MREKIKIEKGKRTVPFLSENHGKLGNLYYIFPVNEKKNQRISKNSLNSGKSQGI